jgi:hypothetical protein
MTSPQQTPPEPFRISFTQEQFYNILESNENKPHPLQRCIMPVVMVRRNNVKVIGTAFAIASGLLMTAEHVIHEIATIRDELATEIIEGVSQVGVLYVAESNPTLELPPDTHLGGILPIWRVTSNPVTDVALLNVNLPIIGTSRLRLGVLRLTVTPPPKGLSCCAIGYTAEATILDSDEVPINNANGLGIEFSPALNGSKGLVGEVHPKGRDKLLLPFPSFALSARLDQQMSGAPIIGSDMMGSTSDVCGIVTRAWEFVEGEEPLGYASLLWPALGLTSPVEESPGSPAREMTLYEMGKRGMVQIRGLEAVVFDPQLPTHIGYKVPGP